MIRLIDLAGYAASTTMLLMTRDMNIRALGMLSRIAVVIISIVVCLLPVLLPHLTLLPMSARRLWDILTGAFRARPSHNTNVPCDSDRSRVVGS